MKFKTMTNSTMLAVAFVTLIPGTSSAGGFDREATVDAVARTLWAEARGEGDYGMILVASVIYNRAGGDPSRLMEVVTQTSQFSCWNAGRPEVYVRNHLDADAWDTCVTLARMLADGAFTPCTTATNYLTVEKSGTGWSTRMEQVFKYRRHVFYVEARRTP